MKTAVTRQQALALLQKYNREPFHLLHALTVEGVIRWYAQELGYGEEADFWGLCGLLHDVDFEKYPQQHCQKAPELLAEIHAEPELVHAVCSHGYGLCSDVEPVHQMEQVLFAVDELTGLIGAAARMRPSKSVSDMEVSSLTAGRWCAPAAARKAPAHSVPHSRAGSPTVRYGRPDHSRSRPPAEWHRVCPHRQAKAPLPRQPASGKRG